jgi:hypothetical protein
MMDRLAQIQQKIESSDIQWLISEVERLRDQVNRYSCGISLLFPHQSYVPNDVEQNLAMIREGIAENAAMKALGCVKDTMRDDIYRHDEQAAERDIFKRIALAVKETDNA